MILHGGVRFPLDFPCPDNVTRLDMNALPMVADMAKYGIKLDITLLNTLTTQFRSRQRNELEPLITAQLGSYQYTVPKSRSLIPFKVSSADHISQLLFEHLKVQRNDEVPTTPKGKRFTTDDDTLNRFKKRHPIVSLILDWRECDKFAGTYTEPLVRLVDSEGFLHPRFNVTVVASGRLSASYIQTIPARSRIGKRIREAFIAPKGCVLVSTDASQIEMRMAAYLSQDPTMIDVFRAGGDIHIRTACGIFGHNYDDTLALYSIFDSPDRDLLTPEQIKWCKDLKQDERLPSKTAGFGTLYENTAMGLQTTILDAISDSQPDRDPDDILIDWPETRVDSLISGFYAEYKRLKPYQDLQHSRVMRWCLVWDPFGRARLVPEARSAIRKIQNEGCRKSSNHPIQAGSQGLLKLAMARLNPIMRKWHAGGQWCTPALQVHDQIISCVTRELANDYAAQAKWEMENAASLGPVPVLSSSDVGERWADL